MLKKYFIAIIPPEPLLSEIHSIKLSISENYKTKGALLSPGHITLHMPFLFDEEKEDKLMACLNSFQFNTSFIVSLKNYNCFEPRVVFINVEEEAELFKFQKQLVNHVKRTLNLFNQADSARGFHPHITVAFRDLKKKVFYDVWGEYKNKACSASFKCNSFYILKQEDAYWRAYKEFFI